MSTEQRTTRIVRSWLEEGVTALPDRVLDAVLDRLPATPQRRPWLRAWRSPYMNNPVRLAIAAAAVLVVALVGYQFLPSNTGSGGPPTATPSQTAAPTPTVAAIPPLPHTESLEPGRYRPYRDLDLTVKAPAGWATCCGSPAWIVWNGEGWNVDGEQKGALLFFEDFTQVTVYDDACKWMSGATSQPGGAEAIAQAFADREGNQARPVTVGGLPGFHVQLVVPGDLQVEQQVDGDATFLDCDSGQYRHWRVPGGERYAQHLEQIEDLYIVDLDEKTIAFSLSHFPQTDDADFQALESMLASVQID